MGPKKKKAGGKKKKVTVDQDDLKSYNLAQREVLVQLLNRMHDLEEQNESIRAGRKQLLEDQIELKVEKVSSFVVNPKVQNDEEKWYKDTLTKKTDKITNFTKNKSVLEYEMKEIEAQLEADIAETEQNYNDRLKEKENRVEVLEEKLKALKEDKLEQKHVIQEIAMLKMQVQFEHKKGMENINNHERAKEFAVRKLDEEMEFKVKET